MVGCTYIGRFRELSNYREPQFMPWKKIASKHISLHRTCYTKNPLD